MKNIKMNKNQLLDILEKNRDEHKEEYDEAIEAYEKQVVKEAEKFLEEIKANPRKNWRYSNHIKAQMPEDHSRDYNLAIEMLQHEVNEEVVLTQQEYAELVQDEWDWAREFAQAYRMSTHKVSKFDALGR